jgi:hypothetical protein
MFAYLFVCHVLKSRSLRRSLISRTILLTPLLTSVKTKASLTDPLDHINPMCVLDVVRVLVKMVTI